MPQQELPVDSASCWSLVSVLTKRVEHNLTSWNAGALGTSALTHIILDVSHQDAKKRNVLDIPETRDEVFKMVIGAPKVLQGIKQGKIQLVLL